MSATVLPPSLLNGRPLAALPAEFDRAIAYGDGLFETILVLDGVAPLWPYHRARLQQSLPRMHLQADLQAVETAMQAMLSGGFTGIVKLLVARCGGMRGYDPRNATGSMFHLAASPLPQYPRVRCEAGVALQLCRQRLACNPSLAGIKHLNRLEQVLAASECNRDIAVEGLLLDDSGYVTEGISSNLFIVCEGELQTPLLDQCGVAGVMRAHVMDMAREQGVAVRERRLTLEDVLSADECFVCNSVFGMWPVLRIGVAEVAGVGGGAPRRVMQPLLDRLHAAGYHRLYV